MLRRLLNLLTLVSLLLCVAAMALWMRSHWEDDYAGWHSWTFDRGWPENKETQVVCVGTHAGVVIVGSVRVLEYGQLAEPVLGGSGMFLNGHYSQEWPLNTMVGHAAESHGFLLFAADYPPRPGFVGERGWAVTAPLWALAVTTAVPAASWARRKARARQRSRRRARSLCLSCGYDLTGNISGVCPDCAQAVGTLP